MQRGLSCCHGLVVATVATPPLGGGGCNGGLPRDVRGRPPAPGLGRLHGGRAFTTGAQGGVGGESDCNNLFGSHSVSAQSGCFVVASAHFWACLGRLRVAPVPMGLTSFPFGTIFRS